MENVTRMSERSRVLQQTLGETSAQADLLENIWKLENLFQNHSDWLQRLEILIKVRSTVGQTDAAAPRSDLSDYRKAVKRGTK